VLDFECIYRTIVLHMSGNKSVFTHLSEMLGRSVNIATTTGQRQRFQALSSDDPHPQPMVNRHDSEYLTYDRWEELVSEHMDDTCHVESLKGKYNNKSTFIMRNFAAICESAVKLPYALPAGLMEQVVCQHLHYLCACKALGNQGELRYNTGATGRKKGTGAAVYANAVLASAMEAEIESMSHGYDLEERLCTSTPLTECNRIHRQLLYRISRQHMRTLGEDRNNVYQLWSTRMIELRKINNESIWRCRYKLDNNKQGERVSEEEVMSEFFKIRKVYQEAHNLASGDEFTVRQDLLSTMRLSPMLNTYIDGEAHAAVKEVMIRTPILFSSARGLEACKVDNLMEQRYEEALKPEGLLACVLGENIAQDALNGRVGTYVNKSPWTHIPASHLHREFRTTYISDWHLRVIENYHKRTGHRVHSRHKPRKYPGLPQECGMRGPSPEDVFDSIRRMSERADMSGYSSVNITADDLRSALHHIEWNDSPAWVCNIHSKGTYHLEIVLAKAEVYMKAWTDFGRGRITCEELH